MGSAEPVIRSAVPLETLISDLILQLLIYMAEDER